MPSPSSTLLLALLGTVASTVAQCIIPSEPLSNNITDPFQLLIQSPTKNPIIHDQLMRYRPNGNDNHLVLPPNGIPTYNTLTLDNGYLRDGNRFAVIDFEVRDLKCCFQLKMFNPDKFNSTMSPTILRRCS